MRFFHTSWTYHLLLLYLIILLIVGEEYRFWSSTYVRFPIFLFYSFCHAFFSTLFSKNFYSYIKQLVKLPLCFNIYVFIWHLIAALKILCSIKIYVSKNKATVWIYSIIMMKSINQNSSINYCSTLRKNSKLFVFRFPGKRLLLNAKKGLILCLLISVHICLAVMPQNMCWRW